MIAHKRRNSNITSSHQDQPRPSSAKVKQINNKLASGNNNRKLRKSNEYLLANTVNRRSQTPMP